jgi:hypothetical protein
VICCPNSSLAVRYRRESYAATRLNVRPRQQYATLQVLRPQQRRSKIFSGGEIAGSGPARCRSPNTARWSIVLELKTYKTVNANMSKVLTFVLTESNAVTGPCTAEYEPVTAGKKKIRAMQRVARIANSKPSWREVINRMPPGISVKGRLIS